MIDFDWCLDFALYFSALPLGAAGLFLLVFTNDLDHQNRRFYNVFLLLLILVSLTDLALMVLRLNKTPVVIQDITSLLSDVCNLPVFPLLTAWILYLCGEPLRRSPAFYTVCIIQFLRLAVYVAYPVTGISHTIIQGGGIQNPLMTIDLILGIALFLFNLVILIRRRRKLTVGQQVFFIACNLLPTALIILCMEFFLIRDQSWQYRMHKEKIIQQQEDLARQKTKIAVLQMRPHFIYNTMMSIYYLCRQDADKAQQVILDFNSYLKKNFTAIASEDTVPFSEELEHTRAYLAVEKIRFEDKLFVEFDTPFTVFRLPPLTLQPIVENAVKYGVSPGLEPLYLSVVTEESDQGVAIVVEDTGPGYAPADDNEPHIALANIRQRLKTMCGGSLEITQRKDGGTKVTIRIPQ